MYLLSTLLIFMALMFSIIFGSPKKLWSMLPVKSVSRILWTYMNKFCFCWHRMQNKWNKTNSNRNLNCGEWVERVCASMHACVRVYKAHIFSTHSRHLSISLITTLRHSIGIYIYAWRINRIYAVLLTIAPSNWNVRTHEICSETARFSRRDSTSCCWCCCCGYGCCIWESMFYITAVW